MSAEERELQIYPIVQDSVQHNARVCIPTWPDRGLYTANESFHLQTVSNIRNLTASLFGVAAGTLGLESYPGFAFYLVGTALVSVLIFFLRTDGKPKGYFYRPFGDLWAGDLMSGLSSFVLTWTLFYGLVRA